MAANKFIQVTAKHVSRITKVTDAVDHANRRVLFRAGGMVRRIASRSIRSVGKFGKPSKPGKPPKARLGWLKRSIHFKVMDDSKRVIIGPTRFARKDNAAKLNEVGGTVRRGKGRVLVPEKAVRKSVFNDEGKRRKRKYADKSEAPYPSKKHPGMMMVLMPDARKYPERPYMVPARDKAVDKYPAMFKDMVKE